VGTFWRCLPPVLSVCCSFVCAFGSFDSQARSGRGKHSLDLPFYPK
jgi:hypothetical protein